MSEIQIPRSVDDLLTSLATPRDYVIDDSPVPALALPQDYPGFVPPPLLQSGSARSGPIALVSAPGAMGKTTLARHIAAQKRAWVWNLGALKLGSNTFVGTLARHFGATQLGEILSDLAEGNGLFLFDAFDEAEILSGIDQIEAFLGELWGTVKDSPGVTAVLFARGETADVLRLILEGLTGSDISDSVWEIDFFDENPALDFTLHQVRLQRDLDHDDAYRGLTQSVFRLLERRLTGRDASDWEDPVVRSFLGYAPVLQAVATLVAQVSNPMAEDAATLVDGEGDESVLDTLLYSLLRREQEKVIGQLREKFPERVDEVKSLERHYAPSEQLHRILYHVIEVTAPRSLDPVDLPGWLQAEYDAAVKAFFPQHPFLNGTGFAGPAFRDYVLAYNLRSEAHYTGAEMHLDAGQFVPTSLLFDFYRLAGQSGSPAKGSHAAYLYESATAWAAGGEGTQTFFVSHEDGSAVHSLAVHRPGGERKPPSTVTVSLTVSDDAPVRFRRRLASALVDVAGDVVLGPRGGEIELSDVRLKCRELVVETSCIRARLTSPGDEVILQAGSYRHVGGNLLVEKKGSGVFSIDWPGGEAHPWSAHFRTHEAEETYDREGAGLALYRILKWMRRDGRPELAKFTEMIDNVVAQGQPIRQDMLRYLLNQGVLRKESEMYILDSSRSGAIGINWGDLRQGRISEKLGSFLDDFIKSRAT